MKNNKKKFKTVHIAAGLIVVMATGFLIKDFISDKDSFNEESENSFSLEKVEKVILNKEVPATINEKGDVVIKIADISEEATFYQLNSGGIDMALFAVKASDGTIRTAFDTCQICNGSPFAYFNQYEDQFQCQNCGNYYRRDMIEQERGGCNPVPIMENEKVVTAEEIIIPAEIIEANAGRFKNWKRS